MAEKIRTRWDCSGCGPGVKADEDGCCAHCGVDALAVSDDGDTSAMHALALLRAERERADDAEDAVAIARDRVAGLEAAARRWYQADGTFIELEPEEVLRRRKEAAGLIERLRDRAWKAEAERDAALVQARAAEQERRRVQKENDDLQLRLVEIRHRVAHLRKDPQDGRTLALTMTFSEAQVRSLAASGRLDITFDFVRETMLLDLQHLLTREG